MYQQEVRKTYVWESDDGIVLTCILRIEPPVPRGPDSPPWGPSWELEKVFPGYAQEGPPLNNERCEALTGMSIDQLAERIIPEAMEYFACVEGPCEY